MEKLCGIRCFRSGTFIHVPEQHNFDFLRLDVQVKDAIHLLHLWLKKRELESRRVKDRDFSGVTDIRELDLLPSFFLRRDS